MTVSRQPDSPATSEVIVRDYAEGDYRACRSLWAELTDYHRSIYGDPSIGGDDPGAGFDNYLAELQPMGSWVARLRLLNGFEAPSGHLVIVIVRLPADQRQGLIPPVLVRAGQHTPSKCNGSCATFWRSVKGPATVGAGVTGKLATIKQA